MMIHITALKKGLLFSQICKRFRIYGSETDVRYKHVFFIKKNFKGKVVIVTGKVNFEQSTIEDG